MPSLELSPQSSIASQDRMYPGMFTVGLIGFSDKLQRNFSSGESVLINFLSKIYTLVLIKKSNLCICSLLTTERGLNETHSKVQPNLQSFRARAQM